jgi:hypothetical protein
MGMMDGFIADVGGGEGIRTLVITGVEFITSKQKGTPGLKLTFSSGGEHKMYKTMYQGKMFNRFLTSFVTDCGFNPRELEVASQNGLGEAWLIDNLRGKTVDIFCAYGEPNSDGKKYLEPVSTAERDFKKWIAEQNGGKKAYNNEPPMSAYENQAQSFVDDMPGEIPF